MNSTTHKHIQWALEFGGALVVIGVGLNILVTQTLGSFDAALVILALFVGFWAFVLGNMTLIASSVWLLSSGKHSHAESMNGTSEEAHATARLHTFRRLCHC